MKYATTIYEQIKDLLKDDLGAIRSSAEIKNELKLKHGTNPRSIILSDCCYNRINDGIRFDRHIFEYISLGEYKYLGENYPYTGIIIHKPKGKKHEVVVGEWNNGKMTIFKTPVYKSSGKPVPAGIINKIRLIVK